MMLYGVTATALGLAIVYAAAWLVARAFFANKAEYNRRLLRELEEKEDGNETKH